MRQLELQAREHNALVASGVLVNKQQIEDHTMKLMTDLLEERNRRAAVEKEKKSIELELETLTTALFEEANQVSKLSL